MNVDKMHLLEESVTELPPPLGGRVKAIGFGVGILGLASASVLGYLQEDHYTRFSFSYLIAWAFFLSITLGALFFVTLQHVTRAGWSVVVRRLAEGLSSQALLMALLSLPLIVPLAMGNHALFSWADHGAVEADHMLHHKAPYLNVGFFIARCVVYFVAWILMARFFFKNSLRQDGSKDPALTLRSERGSAPLMFVYAITVTFAAIDFLMSLEPHWFSTIFGVYFFAGCLVSFFATLILTGLWLNSQGVLRGAIHVEHYHDLGKLLFAFNFFWGYIAFSQFMLIWYANIPEETFWYLTRQEGGWITVALLLIFGHFIIPFVGLISRHAKRRTKILAFWAIWLLAMHWVDLFYLAAPALASRLKDGALAAGTLPLGLLDVACFVGVGGMYLAFFAVTMQKKRLVPWGDPRLNESLNFENA